MKQERQNLLLELEKSQSAFQAERNKLWKLASSPFAVLGEARISATGIDLTPLGDTPPEPKLGLATGSFPATIEAALVMMHPDDLYPFQQTLESSLATGEPFDMNYRLTDGRGGWRWIEGRAVSVEVREGRHVGWVFVNRDFTAQCTAESALRQSLRDLEASRAELKSEQDKLWLLAANAFSILGEARITEHGLEQRFFGDDPPEKKIRLAPGTIPVTVEELMLIIHPDDVTTFQQKVGRSLATGEPFKTTYRLADGRGGWRWLEVRAYSLGERDGKHGHWLSDTRDITEQRETEEALRNSLEELAQLKARLQEENLFLREEMDQKSLHADIIGRSAPLARVLEQVGLVAATSATVLISGETGTGKELIARAIHQRSDRRDRLFVAMNCAAMPATLVESELFGHEKGAFTGAIVRHLGRFEQADGGTLFLDEVGELPVEAQVKMLRVLQSGEFERVGGERSLKVNVRIIAASNRDLEQAVRDGRFRSDLYHRLAIFPIHLPPLRDRREDISLLATYLVSRKAQQLGRKIVSIPAPVLDQLTAYDWPGNVRELENVLERAIILSPGTSIREDAIQVGFADPTRFREHNPRHVANPDAGDTMLAREREHILRVCQATGWKIRGSDGAAAILDLNPGTLYSRMKKLGIRRPSVR